jgi:alanine racemase
MDQFMVDLTKIPDVVMGDEVILFGGGNNGVIRAEQIANWTGSIVDEVVTSVSRRIPRIFIKDGEIIDVVDYLLGNVSGENICN